eukprot:4619634-Pyramimonas_sp.AAC.1
MGASPSPRHCRRPPPLPHQESPYQKGHNREEPSLNPNGVPGSFCGVKLGLIKVSLRSLRAPHIREHPRALKAMRLVGLTGVSPSAKLVKTLTVYILCFYLNLLTLRKVRLETSKCISTIYFVCYVLISLQRSRVCFSKLTYEADGNEGGVAVGKSSVTKELRNERVAVVDLDAIAGQVVRKGRWGYKRLVSKFGTTVSTPTHVVCEKEA